MDIEEGEMGLCTAAKHVPGMRAGDGVRRANYVQWYCAHAARKIGSWCLARFKLPGAGMKTGVIRLGGEASVR